MSLHRLCCCGSGGSCCTDDDACCDSCATSYTVSFGNITHDEGVGGSCDPCTWSAGTATVTRTSRCTYSEAGSYICGPFGPDNCYASCFVRCADRGNGLRFYCEFRMGSAPVIDVILYEQRSASSCLAGTYDYHSVFESVGTFTSYPSTVTVS